MFTKEFFVPSDLDQSEDSLHLLPRKNRPEKRPLRRSNSDELSRTGGEEYFIHKRGK